MFWPRFIDLHNFILLVRTVPFLRKIIFISSYTEKNNYFLLYELIQDLPYMKFAGHCYRNSELVASQLVQWQPTHGSKNRGRQQTTYIDILLKDTGLETVNKVANCMVDCDLWQAMSTRGCQR